ncbi:MAG: bifunctional acetaldehyde-CoA/alcohol dehydrogenase [Kiritimatiellia bacterium]
MKTGTKQKAPDGLKELEVKIQRVKAAQAIYADYPQDKVDAVFRAAALAANEERIILAKMAVEETGMGIVEDKVIKNHFAAEFIYNKYRNEKTCGELSYDPSFGLRRVAEPIGIIAGIVPTTNPTSTAIFKALITLKTRNGIIFSPHPRAEKCTAAAARVIEKAAVAAGAPEGLIGCITGPSVEKSNYLMRHPEISLILATGGPGMVKAAYSSGKPALGVGAGNTPAVIDETAEIEMAVSSVLMSKTFDNGVICASEQSIIVVDKVYEKVKKEFMKRGAYILGPVQKKKIGKLILQNGRINAAIVGQPAAGIAEMAGLKLPEETKVLIGEAEKIGTDEPFAYEKLSPVLALYRAEDYKAAVAKAKALVEFGGIGHTSVIYTDIRNQDRVRIYGETMQTGRILVNMPSSQGAIGDIYNFKLEPSLTLGCGSWGGNSVSENVGVKHLMNVKNIAERRENMLWFRVPPKVFFKYGCMSLALKELTGRKRAVIVTDKPLYDLGFADKVAQTLEDMKMEYEVFYEVKPDPDLTTIRRGMEICNVFKPDVIIALGGGSPMDAAKMMWLMYENPDAKFEEMAMRFMDIEKRICAFPEMGRKARFVAIPTTSGTGSEVTPFAVVTDDATGKKYPIADYALTPDMAIIDPELVLNMPKQLTAFGGIDALTHALEAMVSVLSTEYTNSMALESIRILFKYLPDSYRNGAEDIKAREKVHYAATMAGMAFANAFLGICHSMAHKLGAEFGLAHGLANALLIENVIRFNATDTPLKQTAFPQYTYPTAISRYARVADYLQLGGRSDEQKVKNLISAIHELKKKLDIPTSIKEAGVEETSFLKALDQLSEDAFDDQCTGANPRYPMIREIRALYLEAYNG